MQSPRITVQTVCKDNGADNAHHDWAIRHEGIEIVGIPQEKIHHVD